MPINTKEDQTLDIESSEDASFVPTETDADTDSEMSDAQMVDDGTIVIDSGEDDLEVSPNDDPGAETPAKEEDAEEGDEKTADEKPAESGDEKPAEEAKPDETPAETPAKKEKKAAAAPSKVQTRINEVIRERHEATRERDRLSKENAELKQQLKDSTDAKDVTDLESEKPKAEDFETEGEFYEKLSVWGGEMAVLKAGQKTKPEETTTVTTDDNPVDTLMKLGAETYPDFEEIVLNPDVHISETIFTAAQGSPHAVDIIRHMGQNAEDTNRIAAMKDPMEIAREIGRIETLFEGEEVVVHNVTEDTETPETTETKTEETTVSKAPAPVKPDAGASTAPRDLENASLGDYYKSRGYTREGDREGDRPKVA